MGSFEVWQKSDRAWVQDNKALIARVYRWFLEKHDWPDIELFQHALDQDDVEADARKFAMAKPGIPAFGSGMASNITLQSRHIVDVTGADTLLNLVARLTKLGVDAYLSLPPDDRQLYVSRADVMDRLTPGELQTIDLVPPFLQTDWPSPFSGTTYNDNWTMPAVMSLVRQFKGVDTAKQYVERQLSIIKNHSDEQDARIGIVAKSEPLRAFVVMPIGGEWSDSVHNFIKGVVGSFEAGLTSVRADEIPETGRINDQIAAQLQSCDFIIADITHGNLNVYWELGYAYAWDKPCVRLRATNAEGPPPFDLYDQRRVDYSPEPTDDDAARLKAMIESAIEKVQAKRQQQPDDGSIFHGA
jgi:hypothetical protein